MTAEATVNDRILRARGVVALCSRHLSRLRGAVHPDDVPLRAFLGYLIEEEDESASRLRSLDWRTPSGGAAPDLERAERCLRESLPAAFESLGEGRLSRDVALYRAERMEEERSAFFSRLAERPIASEAAALFAMEGERRSHRVAMLRSILLPSVTDGAGEDRTSLPRADVISLVETMAGFINRLRRFAPAESNEAGSVSGGPASGPATGAVSRARTSLAVLLDRR